MIISIARLAFSTRCRRKGGVSLRFDSTHFNPLPFPSHPNPTAHQIFHLPTSASQEDIKARYYELVRLYHPDSPTSRSVGQDKAQARFHAISAAYKVLQGKSTDSGSPDVGIRQNYHNLSTALWKERQRRRADFNVGMDETWKERLFLGSVLLVRSDLNASESILPSVSSD
ncbi:hypothetical protein NEOLEDRAFT_1062507 [Neolentinus lepideus HHB14362 ss-1]|uniref:J domain-containing protein n=1 Tax=Neolentinus lepideus HHB14362 ss-1 TaxID=1314782 RepID=A0A165TJL9_9AGAM|nr:hypothetical protein NEOLEDRAFT_1062507 [Neolentinus lepideus HHB14362 ss-1]